MIWFDSRKGQRSGARVPILRSEEVDLLRRHLQRRGPVEEGDLAVLVQWAEGARVLASMLDGVLTGRVSVEVLGEQVRFFEAVEKGE